MRRFHYLAIVGLFSLCMAAQSVPAGVDALAKRAEAGDAEAQFELGRAYDEGNRVSQDDGLAVAWYRKSAEQGNAKAENTLGVMYRQGRGVARDKQEALRWYSKAARQALPEADFNIAISYYNGDGVESDPNRAYAWMMIAKRHGSAEAEQALPRIMDDLHGRSEFGSMLLAELYEKGQETPQDLKAAFETYALLTKSDRRDQAAGAQFKLCQFYVKGMGVAPDPVQGKSLCKAAAKSNRGAVVFLGEMAENGIGGEKNLKEAEEWYRDAAAEMIPEGFMSMGRLKLQGSSHNDQRDAYYWFYLASIYKIRGAKEQAQKAEANLSASEISKAQSKAIEWSTTPRWKRGKP